ncbi:MAG: UDP-N-acetylglucosamine 1-carboxyvinyltransferase [Clostridiales bacterium]|jgi:UDP-N-acetylglucosamine 1-carboxyvinyltransferase|nr:UDP-N-acetylglucosamine 1-carboxyvinyltransferase [Clostridiales bacterium]MDD7415440.1 UDP-N-acetylglucosamine 1-carboxyvinyltransferase [Clostridiales bacterium]MDY5731961.1 UDP-N-acetylglucosamine 1-carboxyvinyltransferase [Eubacteriales bacterium]
MSYYIINGGHRLEGAVSVGGAKNAALAIIPAAILCGEPCVIENLPYIDDVRVMTELLSQIGAKTEFSSNGVLCIDPSGINNVCVTFDMVNSLRASYYLLGALLGRYGHAEVSFPGGCPIGQRPIDQHIKGFKALGAEVEIENGIVKAKADKLVGSEIYLDIASVGATINIMLAAARADGITIINNAAKEPYIVDVANFLNMMGASVKGAGTDIIRINGRKQLHGCNYAIIPDQMEAGTFMIAAAATGGDVIINNVIPAHLDAISAKLMETGATVREGNDGRDFYVRVSSSRRLRSVNIKTLPYPGFPTDLQQPMMALLSTAEGTSLVMETMFEERFNHVNGLNRMGANISVSSRTALVQGVKRLMGAQLQVTDLRAGAALVIAAMMADGKSKVENIHYIDRGYEHFEHKLCGLGADIVRLG